MQVISFKNTRLFKRGIWLTAVALIACVAAPAAADGELGRNPAPSLIALGILCTALVYFFWKTQLHRLADEVQDCADSLKVFRGRIEAIISFADIAGAEVFSTGGVHRIAVNLRVRTTLGDRVDFLPQASLWSNLPAIKNVALNLTERANQARRSGDARVP